MKLKISGLSGNEAFCLMQKGFTAGEIVVGNSVFSLGLGGWAGSVGQSLRGGEVDSITSLISEGRHAAMKRMEDEARKHGATGVTGVESHLRHLAGFSEFLAQGSAIHSDRGEKFFTTSASGIDLYCHLDAGYRPIHFAMGNIAYSLGLGRGVKSAFRQLARGEVKEFSSMYNEIRHTALKRIRTEAANAGANAVVDLTLATLFHLSTGTHELILRGTGAHHAAFKQGTVSEADVVTSELTGEELWNLARMGFAPVSLVTATSVYGVGVVGSIGATFKAMSRGELPDLTSLVYEAREHCLDQLRREAERVGGTSVVGNKLIIAELQPGLLEVFGVGTAVKQMENIAPTSETLIPQAIITDRETLSGGGEAPGERATAMRPQQSPAAGCLVFVIVMFMMLAGVITAIITAATKHH